jgi:ribosomal protein S18 acetylase RimI-like enzyme
MIRTAEKQDIPGMKEVLDSTELFPSAYLEEMMSGYLTDPATDDIWFCASAGNQVMAFAYCVPEKLTDGTYNLLAIATRKAWQGKGIGKEMMRFVERWLKENKNRLLIVDTSGAPQYTLTREFYLKLGYTKEAVIRDFWKEGEDKITFRKKL